MVALEGEVTVTFAAVTLPEDVKLWTVALPEAVSVWTATLPEKLAVPNVVLIHAVGLVFVVPKLILPRAVFKAPLPPPTHIKDDEPAPIGRSALFAELMPSAQEVLARTQRMPHEIATFLRCMMLSLKGIMNP